MDDSLIAQKSALLARIEKIQKIENVENMLEVFNNSVLESVEFQFKGSGIRYVSTRLQNDDGDDTRFLNNRLLETFIDYLRDLRERLLKELEE